MARDDCKGSGVYHAACDTESVSGGCDHSKDYEGGSAKGIDVGEEKMW
jgi:hypothetical protein